MKYGDIYAYMHVDIRIHSQISNRVNAQKIKCKCFKILQSSRLRGII